MRLITHKKLVTFRSGFGAPAAHCSVACRAILCLAPLAVAASQLHCGSARPRPPFELRIGTFNSHNLFDDVADGAEPVVDTTTYLSHVAGIAAVLTELDADVVALQEVENQRALDAVAETAVGGLPYSQRILLPTNDPRGIHVAFLSRIALDRVVSHAAEQLPSPSGEFDYRYARDCLEVWLTAGEHPVALFGVHFKSKAFPDDPDKRLAEARHTRLLAQAAEDAVPEAGVVVLGDFNDTPGSPAVDAVLNDGGVEPFVDLAALAPAPVFTTAYDGNPELIDHVVANPLMTDWASRPSIAILHDDAVTRASDHAPVAVTFIVR